MDRQHADAAVHTVIDAPVIKRAGTTEEIAFVPAPQSRLLNGFIGALWAFQLITIFTFVASDGPRESIPGLIYGFAVGLDLVLLFGMLAVVTYAAKNSAITAPLSFGLAVGTMVFGALCGLVGHPSSAWLSDLAFGAVLAVGSVAVFARRAKPEPSVA